MIYRVLLSPPIEDNPDPKSMTFIAAHTQWTCGNICKEDDSMTMPPIPGILTTAAFCLAAGACVSCQAQTAQISSPHRQGKPTHEEVRLRHIEKAANNLARCKELLDAMQAEVEVYGFEQDSPRYTVKAEDIPRLRYIISQLQANPEFAPVRVTMRHSSRLYCLNLDFGEGVKLSLRAERITSPDRSGIGHTGCLYTLPTSELRRELIGIIERALPSKK